MKRLALIIFLIFSTLLPLMADLETTVELATFLSLTRDSTGQPLFSFLAQASLAFASLGNENVKAGLELQGLWAAEILTLPADILKRLFIKINFEGLYLTLGKTRLSFGEGLVFNAGDVIFGGQIPLTDPTGMTLRDETLWLLAINLPVADFSFLEVVVIPFSPLKDSSSSGVDLAYTQLGGRAVFDLVGFKLETGYLLKFDEETHHPYLSLAFNIFFDLYLSAALKIPWSGFSDIKWEDSLVLTGGLFKIFNLTEDSSLALRCEYLYFPLASWQGLSSPPFILFLEGTYQPLSDLSLNLRSFFCPPDLSGIVFLGMDFAIYQGFAFFIAGWCMFGDNDDFYFGFGRQGDLGLNLALRYIY